MACTGCGQRRAVLLDASRAVRQGNLGEAADRLKIVGRSVTTDARAAKDKLLAAAMKRLGR